MSEYLYAVLLGTLVSIYFCAGKQEKDLTLFDSLMTPAATLYYG